MKYMGSKNRHAREILPIILEGRKPGQWYVEPFVGGANIIDRVPGNRIGSDAHPQLIALWQAVANGWLPPREISEQEYRAANAERRIDALTGFIGFPCSYAAKWFGGYARGMSSDGSPRNYADEAYRAIAKQAPHLLGVDFRCSSYADLKIPPQSIIYCDPPYAGTTKYASGAFDHATFWRWCDAMMSEGHTIFVSEYTAPDGWRCVWSKEVNNTLTKDTGSKRGIERLFTKRE
jgi:DNA adenine methylase